MSAQVEFCVNEKKQDYAMKLGEGGEAFFVFETSADIPEDLQTSPLVSPAASPKSLPEVRPPPDLQEPDYLDLETSNSKSNGGVNIPEQTRRAHSDIGEPSAFALLKIKADVLCRQVVALLRLSGLQ